jgi:hypothetical protein
LFDCQIFVIKHDSTNEFSLIRVKACFNYHYYAVCLTLSLNILILYPGAFIGRVGLNDFCAAK